MDIAAARVYLKDMLHGRISKDLTTALKLFRAYYQSDPANRELILSPTSVLTIGKSLTKSDHGQLSFFIDGRQISTRLNSQKRARENAGSSPAATAAKKAKMSKSRSQMPGGGTAAAPPPHHTVGDSRGTRYRPLDLSGSTTALSSSFVPRSQPPWPKVVGGFEFWRCRVCGKADNDTRACQGCGACPGRGARMGERPVKKVSPSTCSLLLTGACTDNPTCAHSLYM